MICRYARKLVSRPHVTQFTMSGGQEYARDITCMSSLVPQHATSSLSISLWKFDLLYHTHRPEIPKIFAPVSHPSSHPVFVDYTTSILIVSFR